MSLDDKFTPNDGSLLDRADCALVGFHKRMGKAWQDSTYKSKDVLARNFHGYSAGAFLLGAALWNPVGIFLGGLQLVNFVTGEKTNVTSLEQEIQAESIGLPRKSMKALDVVSYLFGASTTVAWGYALVDSVLNSNYENFGSQSGMLSMFLGFLFMKTGDYLYKFDAGNPPKKPKRKPVWDVVREMLSSPQPVPVKNYKVVGDEGL